MAKSFKDFFGDFNSMRDKLLYAVGDLAQVPQRATLLEPRVNTFLQSANPVLQTNGKTIMSRLIAVRNLARQEYDKTQILLSEMMAFKTSVESNPLYAQIVTGDTISSISAVVSSLFGKSGDFTFFQQAALKAVSLAGRAASLLAALEKASLEVKTLELLAQQTADYAQGKGLLPDTNVPAGEKPAITKTMIAAGIGIVGLGIYFLRRKK
jgi:hypothetical protein